MLGIVRYPSKLGFGAIAAMAALLFFFAALAFPAVGTCVMSTTAEPNWFDNANILLFGWLAIIQGQIGWFANVPFAVNVVKLVLGKKPVLTAALAQALLLFAAVWTLRPSAGMELLHNEAFDEPVCRLGPGFWLWVTAQTLVCFASIVHWQSVRRSAKA